MVLARVAAAIATLGFVAVLAFAPIALGVFLAICAARGIGAWLGSALWAEVAAFFGALGFYGWYVAPLVRTDAAIAALNEK